MVNTIAELYKTPMFKVDMEEHTSPWTQQQTGIRQGCPLSPYLFIILMTCLFHDVHKGDRQKLNEQRINGMEADEILYADDTICVTQEEEPMNKLLADIETEGTRYGFKLNQTKCEDISFGNAGTVRFKDGTSYRNRKRLSI